MPVQAQYEAAVDTDPVRLDPSDGVLVLGPVFAFPVALQFDAGQSGLDWAFQPDQHLGAAGLAHQAQKLLVLVDGKVRFSEPADVSSAKLLQEPLPVSLVDKRVVVGQFDERARPKLADTVHLGQHYLGGLLLVVVGQENGTGAELAMERTAAAGLHGQPVVLIRVQKLIGRLDSAWLHNHT